MNPHPTSTSYDLSSFLHSDAPDATQMHVNGHEANYGNIEEEIGDEEMDENEEDLIKEIHESWINEENCPELLYYKSDLVLNLLELVSAL